MQQLRQVCAISWQYLRGCSEAELMNAEPDLLVGGQSVEIDLPIITQRTEVVEQGRASVPVAVLKIVAYSLSLGDVVPVIARSHVDRGSIGRPCLIDVVD